MDRYPQGRFSLPLDDAGGSDRVGDVKSVLLGLLPLLDGRDLAATRGEQFVLDAAAAAGQPERDVGQVSAQPRALVVVHAVELGEPGVEYDPLALPLEAAEAALPVVALAEDGDARSRVDRGDGDAFVEVVDPLGQLVLDETAAVSGGPGTITLSAMTFPEKVEPVTAWASRLAST